MDTIRVLRYALEREKEGKRFFEQNAERLGNPAAVKAFKAIAEEEQRHIEFISAELEKFGAAVGKGTEPSLPPTGFFAERADSEFIEQAVAEAMVADLPVLRMAYLIERDFAEFYDTSARSAEGEAKMTLEMLAKWESGHEKLFKRLHDEAYARYTSEPWGG